MSNVSTQKSITITGSSGDVSVGLLRSFLHDFSDDTTVHVVKFGGGLDDLDSLTFEVNTEFDSFNSLSGLLATNQVVKESIRE